MGFGLPITIKEALAKIQNRTYAMPAIPARVRLE